MRCSSVLLPTPLAPTIATISPRSTVSDEITQHVDVLRADAIALVQGGDFDEGHRLRLQTRLRTEVSASRLCRSEAFG